MKISKPKTWFILKKVEITSTFGQTCYLTIFRWYILHTDIKGSELDVVLELHGHGLSWQTESSFVEHEARSTEQSLCLSAGGQNAEVFPCQPPQAWKLWPPWPQPIQRILPLVQSFLRKVLSLTSLLITFRSFHRRPKAVAKGRRLSSALEFVLLMKPKDSLFQLGNLGKASKKNRFFFRK